MITDKEYLNPLSASIASSDFRVLGQILREESEEGYKAEVGPRLYKATKVFFISFTKIPRFVTRSSWMSLKTLVIRQFVTLAFYLLLTYFAFLIVYSFMRFYFPRRF